MRAARGPTPAIRRPEQSNRRQMERGGQMGEAGVVANEEVRMRQHSGDREQIQMLQDGRPRGASIRHVGDHALISRPADQNGIRLVGLEPLNGPGQ